MNKILLKSKLHSIVNCLERIKSKEPITKEKLIQDLDAQDVISINLERAVQQVVDIAVHIISEKNLSLPKTMADSVVALHNLGIIDETSMKNLISAIGFRNLAVHQYDKLDWAIVSDICNHKISVFKDFVRAIDAYINQEN